MSAVSTTATGVSSLSSTSDSFVNTIASKDNKVLRGGGLVAIGVIAAIMIGLVINAGLLNLFDSDSSFGFTDMVGDFILIAFLVCIACLVFAGVAVNYPSSTSGLVAGGAILATVFAAFALVVPWVFKYDIGTRIAKITGKTEPTVMSSLVGGGIILLAYMAVFLLAFGATYVIAVKI